MRICNACSSVRGAALLHGPCPISSTLQPACGRGRAQCVLCASWPATKLTCSGCSHHLLEIAFVDVLVSIIRGASAKSTISLHTCVLRDATAVLFAVVLNVVTIAVVPLQNTISGLHHCMTWVRLATQGFALEKLIAARAKCTDESERVVARVQIWRDHAELLQMVKGAMCK